MTEPGGKEPWPIAEIFGPTIQGEGPLAGMPCHFIRFAGCDFKCVWCDSPQAVIPKPGHIFKLSCIGIMQALSELQGMPKWVILSGGNPARLDLTNLVRELHRNGYRVQVETQGSLWHKWLFDVDLIVMSPKPPSSGYCQDPELLALFFARHTARLAVKIVVFNEEDLNYAKNVHRRYAPYYPNIPFFVSCGNVPEEAVGHATDPERLAALGPADVPSSRAGRYRWLAQAVGQDPELAEVRVLPQLHIYAWGNEHGR